MPNHFTTTGMVILCLGAILLWLGIATSVYADQAEPQSSSEPTHDLAYLSELSLEELLNIEITVASKLEELYQEAPSTVTVITRDEIRRMAVTSVEELLNYVAGVTVTYDTFQTRTSRINVRGVQSPFQTAVLFLLDGRPFNDMFYGTSTLITRHITLENILRLEVIRGPGSALYGANAFAGVVNIVTNTDITGVAVSAGDIGRKSLAVNYHELIAFDNTRTLSLTAFAQGYFEDGYHYRNITDTWGQTDDTRDAIQGVDVSATIAYDGLSLTLNNITRQSHGYLGYGAIGPQNRGHWRQSFVALDYEKPLLNERLHFSLGLRWADEWQNVMSTLIPAGIMLGEQSYDIEYVGGPISTMRGARAFSEAVLSLTEQHSLSLGAMGEYRYVAEMSHLLNYDPVTLEPLPQLSRLEEPELNWANPDAKQTLGAVYLQGKEEMSLGTSQRVILTAGLRLDYNSDHGSAVSPRAAIVYQTPYHSIAKLMYGRAFLAPNFSELHQRNNPVTAGNPNLQEETMESIEASYTQSLAGIFSGTMTGFAQRVTDLITVGDGVEESGARRYINSGTLRTAGLEFEARFLPMKGPLSGIDARVTYAYVRGDYSDSTELLVEQPKHSGSAIVNYHIGDIDLNVSGRFRGKSPQLPGEGTATTVNGKISYALSERIALGIAAENVFDKIHMGPSTYFQTTGIPQRGRVLFAELRYERP